MRPENIVSEAMQRWPDRLRVEAGPEVGRLHARSNLLPELSAWLFSDADCAFAGLVVEEGADTWELRYLFYSRDAPGWIDGSASSQS